MKENPFLRSGFTTVTTDYGKAYRLDIDDNLYILVTNGNQNGLPTENDICLCVYDGNGIPQTESMHYTSIAFAIECLERDLGINGVAT